MKDTLFIYGPGHYPLNEHFFKTIPDNVEVIGNGNELIDIRKITGKYKKVVIHGHGNVIDRGTIIEASTINISKHSELTHKLLLELQEKTGATDFHILSCHAGGLVNQLHENANKFFDQTSVNSYSSSKYKTRVFHNIRRAHDILAHDGDSSDFITFNATTDPQTANHTIIISDSNSGHNKAMTVKLTSPKEAENIKEIKPYLQNMVSVFSTSASDKFRNRIAQQLYDHSKTITTEDIKKYNNEALLIAVRRNKPERVRAYIDNGADINIRLDHGEPALVWATRHNYTKCAKYFIEAGANVNISCNKGTTALSHALYKDNEEIAKCLIKAGADLICPFSEKIIKERLEQYINITFIKAYYKNDIDTITKLANEVQLASVGNNVLIESAKNNKKIVFKCLLDKHYNPTICNRYDKTAISTAIETNNLDICQILLDCKKTYIYDALITAAFTANNNEVLELVLRNSNKLTKPNNDIINKLFITACESSDIAKTKLFLKCGADPTLTSDDGTTVVSIIRKQRNKQLNKILQNNLDKSLRSSACDGNIDKCKRLIRYGANPNDKDKHGITALHLAAKYDHSNICVTLINSKANPNIKDNLQMTPLHYAAKDGKLNTVRTLLDINNNNIFKPRSNPNIRDSQGMTALHHAAKNGHIKTYNLFFGRSHVNHNIKDILRNKPSTLLKNNLERDYTNSKLNNKVATIISIDTGNNTSEITLNDNPRGSFLERTSQIKQTSYERY